MTETFKTNMLELWAAFGDIPINDNDEIEEAFWGYPVGTDRFEIWLRFDELYDGGVLQLICDYDEEMSK